MTSNRSESRPCSVGSCCCRYKRRGVTEAARFSDRVASPCRHEPNPRIEGAAHARGVTVGEAKRVCCSVPGSAVRVGTFWCPYSLV